MKADHFVSVDLVYVHLDMGPLVQWFPIWVSLCLINVKRYITTGIHFPGIAGSSTRSKMHSRRSVGFKEVRHIGTGGRVNLHHFTLMAWYWKLFRRIRLFWITLLQRLGPGEWSRRMGRSKAGFWSPRRGVWCKFFVQALISLSPSASSELYTSAVFTRKRVNCPIHPGSS